MLTAVLYPDSSSASTEGTPHSARHFLSNQHRGQLTQPPAARQQIASRHCQSDSTEEESRHSHSKHLVFLPIIHMIVAGHIDAAWNVPYLKGSKESEFIHLKGRIWTKPCTVIDGGRYGVVGDQKRSRLLDNTEELIVMQSESNKFKAFAV